MALYISCMLFVVKEASTLLTLCGIANCAKNGTTGKMCPPADVSFPRQCHKKLLSFNFKNPVHSIFRNKNSTLEINVSHFKALHLQQWKPSASACAFGNKEQYQKIANIVTQCKTPRKR